MVDMPMSATPGLLVWPHDLFVSTRAGTHPDENVAALGDPHTLAERLVTEARTLQSAVALITVVGAVSRAFDPRVSA